MKPRYGNLRLSLEYKHLLTIGTLRSFAIETREAELSDIAYGEWECEPIIVLVTSRLWHAANLKIRTVMKQKRLEGYGLSGYALRISYDL